MALLESLLKNEYVVANSVVQQLKDTTAKSLSGMNGMIIMMVFGIVIGLIPGKLMGTIMVSMCEADATLLYHHINSQRFLCAIVITIFFNVVVNLIMLRKVKSVDMLESLKVIE